MTDTRIRWQQTLDKLTGFLDQWDAFALPDRQRGYVLAELQRMETAGVPLVTAALMMGLPEQIDTCLSIMQIQLGVTSTWLRLAPEAKPWPTGPDGVPLKQELRGKFQRCHVMNVGQSTEKLTEAEAKNFTSDKLSQLVRLGRSVYQTIDIGFQPREVTIPNAITILRAWGYGIVTPRVRDGFRQGDESSPIPNRWLIEEMTAEQASAAPQQPQTDRKGKAA